MSTGSTDSRADARAGVSLGAQGSASCVRARALGVRAQRSASPTMIASELRRLPRLPCVRSSSARLGSPACARRLDGPGGRALGRSWPGGRPRRTPRRPRAGRRRARRTRRGSAASRSPGAGRVVLQGGDRGLDLERALCPPERSVARCELGCSRRRAFPTRCSRSRSGC